MTYPPLPRRVPAPRELLPFLQLRRRSGSLTARRLAGAHTIDDLRTLARRRAPDGPFHYVDGGADDESGLRRAREAYEDAVLHPAVLRDVSAVDPSTTVLGARSALPFGFAPTGGTRMSHAAGELAVGRAAARAGIPYALSTVGTTSMADLAAGAPDARRWFQIYLLGDRDRSRSMLAEARTHGYDTLVVTVDAPVVGNRLRDRRSGMSFPPQLTWGTFARAARHWRWCLDLLTTEPYRFTFEESGVRRADLKAVTGFTDASATWDELDWLRDAWDGPLVLKGVQRLDDARRAVDAGVDGLVLSTHGGRQLDRSAPPLHLLPSVVAELGSEVEVMIDSGVRSGTDIVVALALGAHFVLVGRAYLYGLMAGGEAGVDRCVEILTAEVTRAMALLGVAGVDELRPDHVTLLTRHRPVVG